MPPSAAALLLRAISPLKDWDWAYRSAVPLPATSMSCCPVSQHYELKIGTKSVTVTKYLQGLLFQELSETRKAQQRAFYHRLLEVPSLKDAAGRIFEQATHQPFNKGGRFRLWRILDASDRLSAIAPFDLNRAEEFRNLKDGGATLHKPNPSRLLPERKGVYFMPLKSNLTSIDSIIFVEISKMLVVILLQITVGSTKRSELMRYMRYCHRSCGRQKCT